MSQVSATPPDRAEHTLANHHNRDLRALKNKTFLVLFASLRECPDMFRYKRIARTGVCNAAASTVHSLY